MSELCKVEGCSRPAYRDGLCRHHLVRNRNGQLYTYNNRTMGIAQWSRATGMHQDTLCSRLRAGWSIEDAITRPVQQHNGAVVENFSPLAGTGRRTRSQSQAGDG
jgi:hypothetical protein